MENKLRTRIRTGIFGGSFNPIHIGHLALANCLCENDEVDEVWFLVSPQNPFKQNESLLDDKTRLRLVEAAIDGYSKFMASDFEFHLPRPSYTVNTLEKLSEAYPERDFYLIIGADNWAAFDRWKSPEQILANHHILIYPRRGYYIDVNTLPINVKAVDTPLLEVSSTFIRESIAQGKDMRFFLNPNVDRIIKKDGLYKQE
ncbi:MAG: nicotinate (nicotinamide) nucleotide adenylyltransferase [Phocaeicola sp.]|nr:nicotinate (nicotinamide) nucleotide adenylyltransferase [Phocaeicola sp.]